MGLITDGIEMEAYIGFCLVCWRFIPRYTPHHFRLQTAYTHLQAQLTWQAFSNNIGLELHDISGRLDDIGIRLTSSNETEEY